MLQDEYNEGYYREHGVMVSITNEENCPSERQFRYWYQSNYGKKKRNEQKYGKRKARWHLHWYYDVGGMLLTFESQESFWTSDAVLNHYFDCSRSGTRECIRIAASLLDNRSVEQVVSA
jgi:hypothetical protein